MKIKACAGKYAQIPAKIKFYRIGKWSLKANEYYYSTLKYTFNLIYEECSLWSPHNIDKFNTSALQNKKIDPNEIINGNMQHDSWIIDSIHLKVNG
jgi:hypothetical protein